MLSEMRRGGAFGEGLKVERSKREGVWEWQANEVMSYKLEGQVSQVGVRMSAQSQVGNHKIEDSAEFRFSWAKSRDKESR